MSRKRFLVVVLKLKSLLAASLTSEPFQFLQFVLQTRLSATASASHSDINVTNGGTAPMAVMRGTVVSLLCLWSLHTILLLSHKSLLFGPSHHERVPFVHPAQSLLITPNPQKTPN